MKREPLYISVGPGPPGITTLIWKDVPGVASLHIFQTISFRNLTTRAVPRQLSASYLEWQLEYELKRNKKESFSSIHNSSIHMRKELQFTIPNFEESTQLWYRVSHPIKHRGFEDKFLEVPLPCLAVASCSSGPQAGGTP